WPSTYGPAATTSTAVGNLNPWEVAFSVSPPIPTLTKRPPFAPAHRPQRAAVHRLSKVGHARGDISRRVHALCAPSPREGGKKRRAQVSWRMEGEDCGRTKEGAKCGPLRSPAVQMATWLVKLPVGAVIDPAARLLLLRRPRGEKRPTQRCSPSITRVAVDPHSQRFSARRHLVVPAPRDLPRCDVYLANGPRLIEAA
ncbi:unnamed protein product, partial [Ixodes pacificus]